MFNLMMDVAVAGACVAAMTNTSHHGQYYNPYGAGTAVQSKGAHRLNYVPNTSHVRPVVPYQVTNPYTQGRVKALFIGINYFGTSSELSGCVNDVRTMLNTLQRVQFPIQEACILVDDPSFPGCTGAPTKQNILSHLKWLVEGARPGDTFFLHFSGHGSQVRDDTGDEKDGMDETLVPVDFKTAGMIVDDDIFNLVVAPLPPGARLTAVMDCCHSGTLMDLPYEFVANQYSHGQQQMQCVSQKGVGLQCDVVLFSGCADNQTSADVSNVSSFGTGAAGAGGACTNALAQVLTTTAGLTGIDLLKKMRDVLRAKKYSQVPQLSSSKPIDLSKQFSFFGALNVTQNFIPMGFPQQAPAMYQPSRVPPQPVPQQPQPGYPPQPQGAYYPQQQQQPYQQPGYPPQAQPGYPQQPGYPPQQPQGYPPQPGYPPQAQGYPAQPQGYPQQQPPSPYTIQPQTQPAYPGYPQQPQGYPQQPQGYAPNPGYVNPYANSVGGVQYY